MNNRICANCLLPIHENEMGLRHRGNNTLHSESRCIALLQQKIDSLKQPKHNFGSVVQMGRRLIGNDSSEQQR